MSYKQLLAFFIFLLIISGCTGGGDTNKANLEEDIYEEGKKIVKLYAQAYNGDKEAESEVKNLVESFLTTYSDKYNSASVDDSFAEDIELLKVTYELYNLEQFNESFGVSSGDSEETKKELKNLLLAIKETYGISLEN